MKSGKPLCNKTALGGEPCALRRGHDLGPGSNRHQSARHLADQKADIDGWVARCSGQPGTVEVEDYLLYRGSAAKRRHGSERRGRVAALPNTLTDDEWAQILNDYGHRCAYCGGSDMSLHQEHVIPVVQGGGRTADNIVPACGTCNSSKGARTPEQWRPSITTVRRYWDGPDDDDEDF